MFVKYIFDYLRPLGAQPESVACTCEDIWTEGRRTPIFAVAQLLRGGGVLKVLHGQTVA